MASRAYATTGRAPARVVVAGLLAGIGVAGLVGVAVRMWRLHEADARIAAARTVIEDIRLREELYFARFYQYCPAPPAPAFIPSEAPATLASDSHAWALLGVPPGYLGWFRFSVTVSETADEFTVLAEADFDGDGTLLVLELPFGAHEPRLYRAPGHRDVAPEWE